MEELAAVAESGFLPILRQVPGFQEYVLVQTDEGVLSTSTFTDQAGAEESTRRRPTGCSKIWPGLQRAADGDDRERLAA